jgi:hypothetical protein
MKAIYVEEELESHGGSKSGRIRPDHTNNSHDHLWGIRIQPHVSELANGTKHRPGCRSICFYRSGISGW